MDNLITINRDELYKQVWNKPITHIAKEYGISDSAVIKICRKLNVPTPGAGHWAKVKHGKPVKVIDLPSVDEHFKTTYPLDSLQYKKKVLNEMQSKVSGKIKVPAKLKNPHPLVQATLERLNGKYNPQKEDLFLNISSKLYPRALRIMDTLIKNMESCGCKVKNRYTRTMGIYYDNVEVVFSLFERKRRGIINVQDQLIKTGELVLTINENYLGFPLKRRFSDDEKHKLEDYLDDFVFNVFFALDIKKKERIKWQVQQEERQKKENLLREEQQRQIAIKEAQENKIKKLLEFSSAYNNTHILKSFVNKVKEFSVIFPEKKEQIDLWIKWAEDYIHSFDPFESGAFITYLDDLLPDML